MKTLLQHSKVLMAAGFVALALQGCGGGGGGSSTSSASTGSSSSDSGSSSSGSSSSGSSSSGSSSGSSSSSSSLSISVKGNTFVDGSGKVVQLRGVNVSGLEFVLMGTWTTDPWGGQTGTTVPQWSTIASWGANVVRLPLNERSWLGTTCTNTDGSTLNPDPAGVYKSTVAAAVTAAQAAGMYVILDLHWTAPGNFCPHAQDIMANTDNSVAFWTSVAQTFKGNPGVMFELFNEPMLWSESSLMFDTAETQTMSPAGGPATTDSWTSAGMNTLLAAVRATGATNVVLVGGQNFSSDLSQWLTSKPVDPLNQYAAVWHAYPTYGSTYGTAAWDLPNYGQAAYDSASAILNAGIPVIITEFGDHNATGSVGAPFASNLLPWADTNGVSYLGWTWDDWSGSDYILIKDAAGTPSDGYGVYVKQHYLCRAAGNTTCK